MLIVSKKVTLYRKLASVLNHECQMPMLCLWNYPKYCLLQIGCCSCLFYTCVVWFCPIPIDFSIITRWQGVGSWVLENEHEVGQKSEAVYLITVYISNSVFFTYSCLCTQFLLMHKRCEQAGCLFFWLTLRGSCLWNWTLA